MIFLLIIRKKSYIKCNAFYFRSLLLKININTMKTVIRFGSREILNAHLDLEEKLIVEIFQLSMNQVILTDISDVYSLQDLDVIQENIKTVFNLEVSQDELEKLTVSQLVLKITNN